jgi:hypothetical protein
MEGCWKGARKPFWKLILERQGANQDIAERLTQVSAGEQARTSSKLPTR